MESGADYDYVSRSKMSAVTGSPGNIYGLRSLESIRGELPKDRYKHKKNFHSIMNEIKRVQRAEMRSKNTQKMEEETQEEMVYGLNMGIPSHMNRQQREDEHLLRRHLVKASTDKLAKNIEKYEKQR